MQVVVTNEEWLDQPLPCKPHFCLLGDKSELRVGLKNAQLGLALAGFINATRMILRNIPDYKDWIEFMTVTASYDLMLAELIDSMTKYSEIWGSFLRLIKGGTTGQF